MTRWNRIAISLTNKIEMEPVPIISDGAVATKGFGDGRTIPVLIIDTSKRPDIEDLVHAHQHLGSGNVESSWSKPSRFNARNLRLVLSFSKLCQCVVILEFDILRQGGVIDQIINAEGVYIQPGRDGDRVSTTIDKPRLAVEVHSKYFKSEWEQIFLKCLTKKFKKDGLTQKNAKQAAKEFLNQWRQTFSFRMR